MCIGNSHELYNEYDKTKEDFFLTTADALGGWGYADFAMTGYDPNANAILNVRIKGVNILKTSQSGDIQLVEEVKKNSVGGAKPPGKIFWTL